MPLVKIEGKYWLDSTAIVAAYPRVERDQTRGIRIMLSGGHFLDLSGAAVAEAEKLLDSLMIPKLPPANP